MTFFLRGRPPLAPLSRAAVVLASEVALPPRRPSATAAGFLRATVGPRLVLLDRFSVSLVGHNFPRMQMRVASRHIKHAGSSSRSGFYRDRGSFGESQPCHEFGGEVSGMVHSLRAEGACHLCFIAGDWNPAEYLAALVRAANGHLAARHHVMRFHVVKNKRTAWVCQEGGETPP
jgi:hypothetical protein